MTLHFYFNSWNFLFLQKTMEAFIIILSVTQLLYIVAIHGAAAYNIYIWKSRFLFFFFLVGMRECMYDCIVLFPSYFILLYLWFIYFYFYVIWMTGFVLTWDHVVSKSNKEHYICIFLLFLLSFKLGDKAVSIVIANIINCRGW